MPYGCHVLNLSRCDAVCRNPADHPARELLLFLETNKSGLDGDS
jgi:hypothetical protein